METNHAFVKGYVPPKTETIIFFETSEVLCQSGDLDFGSSSEDVTREDFEW